MLGHKTSLNKFKKVKTLVCISFDHNGIKQKKTRGILEMFKQMEVKHFMNNEWVHEENKSEIKYFS
jgi:hypothetical protein